MNHTKNTSEKEEYSCKCNPQTSIPFLDIECSIKDGIIDTDLYKKETDRNQYLLTNSCHPAQTKANIPYSLSLRICSTEHKEINRL